MRPRYDPGTSSTLSLSFLKCITITVAVVDKFHNHTDITVSVVHSLIIMNVVAQLYSYNLTTVSAVSK